MGFKEERKFRLGRAGEVMVKNWLLARGFAVIPTGFIETGGAPSLETISKNLILPDLQVFKDGVAKWVEVKTKERSVLFRLAGRVRSGFNWRHWLAYCEIQDATQIQVSIAILHLFNCELWIQGVNELKHSVIYNPPHESFGGDAMALWDRERWEIHKVDGSGGVQLCAPYRKPPTPPKPIQAEPEKPKCKQLRLF